MSSPIFNFHDTILLAIAFQSMLFVLLLGLAKRDHHISDWFLIGFFIVQTAIPLHLLISFGDQISGLMLSRAPWLFKTLDLAYWLEGPLLLWYTRSLLFKEFQLKTSDCLYMIPAVLYFVYTLLTFHTLDAEAKIAYIVENKDLLAPSLQHSIEVLREVVFVFFGVYCLIEIRHAQQQIHHRYSDMVKIDLVWLGSLVAAFMILRAWSLMVLGVAFVQPDLGPNVFDTMGLVGNYLLFFIVWSLIFFSLTRTSIFTGKITRTNAHSANDEVEIDPEVSQKISRHMEFHKPYLSPYLNLEELASQLNMHPRALSSAIKHSFHTNFYEFINSYRIEEAKKLLTDPEQPNRTMIDILGESGFNSKATFNAFFKKVVGMTPTQYRSSANSQVP